MTNTMIERIARTWWEREHSVSFRDSADPTAPAQFYPGDWNGASLADRDHALANARSVLTAMREPTEGMALAGVNAPNYLEDQSSRRGCTNIYAAMIGAALGEE